MYGFVNERVSFSMMFRGEITLMKKSLKSMLKSGKLPYITADIEMNFLGMKQYLDYEVVYKSEPVVYEDSRYIMVGFDMTKFGYADTNSIVKGAKMAFHSYLFSVLVLYVDNGMISRMEYNYPELSDVLRKIGYAHLFSDYYDIKKDEWKSVLERFEEEYKDGIPGTGDAWVEVFYSQHSNGLGIKDNNFMPVYIISLEDGSMYRFVNERIRYNSYLSSKNIYKLVKEGGLKEVSHDELLKLDKLPYIGCPIGQAMIKGHLGTDIKK